MGWAKVCCAAGGVRRGGDRGGGFGRAARWEFQAKKNGHVSQPTLDSSSGALDCCPGARPKAEGSCPGQRAAERGRAVRPLLCFYLGVLTCPEAPTSRKGGAATRLQ